MNMRRRDVKKNQEKFATKLRYIFVIFSNIY